MSIQKTADEIKDILENTSDIREAIETIIIYLGDPYEEAYNRGILNGESETQAAASALAATSLVPKLQLGNAYRY